MSGNFIISTQEEIDSDLIKIKSINIENNQSTNRNYFNYIKKILCGCLKIVLMISWEIVKFIILYIFMMLSNLLNLLKGLFNKLKKNKEGKNKKDNMDRKNPCLCDEQKLSDLSSNKCFKNLDKMIKSSNFNVSGVKFTKFIPLLTIIVTKLSSYDKYIGNLENKLTEFSKSILKIKKSHEIILNNKSEKEKKPQNTRIYDSSDLLNVEYYDENHELLPDSYYIDKKMIKETHSLMMIGLSLSKQIQNFKEKNRIYQNSRIQSYKFLTINFIEQIIDREIECSGCNNINVKYNKIMKSLDKKQLKIIDDIFTKTRTKSIHAYEIGKYVNFITDPNNNSKGDHQSLFLTLAINGWPILLRIAEMSFKAF